MSPVESYLAELSRRLAERLPKDVVEARLRETREHLRTSVEEVGEAEAIARFGPAAANARAIVRQARGYDVKGAASLSLASGLALAASIVVACLVFEQGPFRNALLIEMWITFLAMIYFAARCVQTRRWLVLPVLAWGGLAFATSLLLPAAIPARVSPALLDGEIREARRSVALWNERERDVAAWRGGKALEHVALGAWRTSATWYVVGVPFGISVPSDVQYDAQRFENSLAHPQENWARFGEGYARTVAQGKSDAIARLAALERGLIAPPVSPATLLLRWLMCFGQLAVVLTAYNAVALLLGKLADGLPRRRRAPIQRST